MRDPADRRRFGVCGAGAVGCFFGAALARAGHRVVMIARGQHLQAIARDGIRVETSAGAFRAVPEMVTVDPAAAGNVDAVLLAVKAWQVREAAAGVRPLLAPAGRVLPLQNGVEATQQIDEVLGPGHALMGLARIVCMLTAPGVVRHVALQPTIALGEPSGAPLSPSARALAAALRGSGVTVEEPADMHAALWEKLLFQRAVSGVGAVSRSTIGAMRACPETRALIAQLMEEVHAVGRASGVPLGDDCVARALAFVDALAPQSTASMQRDIIDGKPSELDAIIGVLVRRGEELGVATPGARFVYSSLLPQERFARQGGNV